MTEPATFAEVVDAIREHTAHLLGTTISYDEDDWATATELPGWTRSHVAAHLVQEAEGLIAALGDGEEHEPLSSDERRLALERRALCAGLALQISLDETSGQLQRQLQQLEGDERPIRLAESWTIPAHDVPVLRLREVVLHHFDLIGPEALDVPPSILRLLLAFEVARPRANPLPPVLLLSDDGFSARLGDEDREATTVIGPSPDLLVLLARDIISPNISGADLVER